MDATQRRAADRHIVAVLVVLGVALVLHLAGLGSAILNLAREAMDPNGFFGIFGSGAASRTDEELGELVGRGSTLVVCGLYSALGLVWIPITSWGVYTRKPWGRIGALVYFATTLPTCCCTPLGAYGLYALMRADVKQLFDEKR